MNVSLLFMRHFVRLGIAGAILALAIELSAQTPSPKGNIAGVVSNTSTGKFLEGATVAIRELSRTEVTDATGRYRFVDLPPGEYTVVVFYTGLEESRGTATVAAGTATTLNFELNSAVYRLDAFVVAGEREGNAASITRQRTADSVKHVVALDAFGNLANDNAGELLLRLPGIAGTHDLDGNISTVSIRGAAANLNMVTVDGNPMASNFGDSRSFALRSISGALFDEIEVTKAPTPDMPADSIGGAINFKSASPLDLKGPRRISYSATVRWAPRWLENVPMAHDHPVHPVIKLGARDVFSVGGGERNLGVTVNLFYSENASGGFTGTNAYENTLSRRAFLYDFQSRDIFNNRKQKSVSARFDYRFSPVSTFTLGAILNEDDQPYNRLIIFRAVTAQTVAAIGANGQPTGTGAILPNYTEAFTQVRPLNTSRVVLTTQLFGFNDRQRQVNAGGRHVFNRAELTYSAAHSQSKSILDTGENGGREGGDLDMELRGIGWTVDRGASEEYPTWTQTEGPDISNPAFYTPTAMARRNNSKLIETWTARGDLKYVFTSARPATAKTGFNFRRQEMRRNNADRQWTPPATAGVLSGLNNYERVETSFESKLGRQIPYVDAADAAADLRNNPGRWPENIYYATTRTFIGNDRVREDVFAGYGQGQMLFGPLKALAGVRYERTDVESKGFVASRVLSTTAQRNANPGAAGTADYNNRRVTTGAYDHWFPGVYLTYNLTRQLQFRANWSNSIGRPGFSTLVPSFSVNPATETVNANNAGLGPQKSENWDAGFEYYFEPVGLFSANVFRKNLTGFIVTGTVGTIESGPNNGFNGDYSGYTLTSTFNGGTAVIEGFEIGYQQRFEFLPKPFSGLTAFANYTWLRTEGDYGESTARSTTDVLNFIPETINLGVSFAYRRLVARVMWNETGQYLNSYNNNPALLRYTSRRAMLDASVSYRLHKAWTAFVDVRNITNSVRSWERAAGMTNSYIFFTALNLGVKGEF